MTRGSIARRTSAGTVDAAALELIAGARGCFLMSMQVVLAAATASTYALGRPAAKGITPTTPVTTLIEGTTLENGTALTSATALAWGTGPTVPTAFYRRVGFPATITSSIVWTFEKGLFIPGGASIVLWNLASNGVVDVNITVDEQ